MEGSFFILGGILGVIFGYIVHPTVPLSFECTESAIIKGQAECVRYEKKQTQENTNGKTAENL